MATFVAPGDVLTTIGRAAGAPLDDLLDGGDFAAGLLAAAADWMLRAGHANAARELLAAAGAEVAPLGAVGIPGERSAAAAPPSVELELAWAADTPFHFPSFGEGYGDDHEAAARSERGVRRAPLAAALAPVHAAATAIARGRGIASAIAWAQKNAFRSARGVNVAGETGEDGESEGESEGSGAAGEGGGAGMGGLAWRLATAYFAALLRGDELTLENLWSEVGEADGDAGMAGGGKAGSAAPNARPGAAGAALPGAAGPSAPSAPTAPLAPTRADGARAASPSLATALPLALRAQLALAWSESAFPPLAPAASRARMDDAGALIGAAALAVAAGTESEGTPAPSIGLPPPLLLPPAITPLLARAPTLAAVADEFRSAALAANAIAPARAATLVRVVGAGRAVAPSLARLARLPAAIRSLPIAAVAASAGGTREGGELPLDAPPLPRIAGREGAHPRVLCPVTRTLCGPGNVPVALRCGHVISQEAATRLASGEGLRGYSRSFAASGRVRCFTCAGSMTPVGLLIPLPSLVEGGEEEGPGEEEGGGGESGGGGATRGAPESSPSAIDL
jgi:hypothetical protein